MVLSMYFSTSQKSLYFFTSLPNVCLFRCLCVKKKKKNQLYFQLPPSQPCKIGLGRIQGVGEPINQVTVALSFLDNNNAAYS